MKKRFLITACIAAGIMLLIWLVASGLGHEEIARFSIGNGRSLAIYAEGVVHFEPPGFVYCSITQGKTTLLPKRTFLGIGIHRIPPGQFATVIDPSGNLVAITLNGNVEFLHDLQTQETWPTKYAYTDEQTAAFAKRALATFASAGEKLPCDRLARDEYNLAIEQARKAKSTKAPPGVESSASDSKLW